jgi:geranylgeranyl pyrophosphate synthase
LWQYVEKHKPQIEKSLREFLPLAPPNIETKFNEAVEYALVFRRETIASGADFARRGTRRRKDGLILPAACAVEFIHTSSLIFDDLPCMDNAPERRGKTSLHEKFGEGLAVLVGIGFLNAAYGLVFVNHAECAGTSDAAHAELSNASARREWSAGNRLIWRWRKARGDASDYESESIRNLKTSALMRLVCESARFWRAQIIRTRASFALRRTFRRCLSAFRRFD